MSNPGAFEFEFADVTLVLGVALLSVFAVMLVGIAGEPFGMKRRVAQALAFGGVGVAALLALALGVFVFIANADAGEHETLVGKWLTSEYDVVVADEDLGALLDYETVEATVDGEERFAALADNGTDLVLLTSAGRN